LGSDIVEKLEIFALSNFRQTPVYQKSQPRLRSAVHERILQSHTRALAEPPGQIFQSAFYGQFFHRISAKSEFFNNISLNTLPMISGDYTALERTLFVEDLDPASLEIWEANVAAHELGISLLKPGASCAEVTHKINDFFAERDLPPYRSFGYGHTFGVLYRYYGREAGLELREDIGTVLEPGMVVSMEPMLTIPDGQPGAGGYREHDILIINEDGNENITGYPYGPDFNIVG